LWDREQKCNNWSRDCKKVVKEIGKDNLWLTDGKTVSIKALIERSKAALTKNIEETWKKRSKFTT